MFYGGFFDNFRGINEVVTVLSKANRLFYVINLYMYIIVLHIHNCEYFIIGRI